MANKKDPGPPKFEPQEFIKAAPSLFGVQPEVMAGALYGVTAPLTKAEAEAKLKDFKVREVKA